MAILAEKNYRVKQNEQFADFDTDGQLVLQKDGASSDSHV